jgi:hypothetical protein
MKDQIMSHTYTLATESYNERRYGRPYIALCDASAKVVSWGNWLGTHGSDGELSITVPAGACILMRGQKDTRGNGGDPRYALCIDGKVEVWSTNKMTVINAYREAKAASADVDTDALIAERANLMARIAEIDSIIASNSVAN